MFAPGPVAGSLDLWSCFERSVAAHGEKEAILTEDTVTTFNDWYAQSAGFRRVYGELSLAPGDRVLLWTGNSPGAAAALTACWAEGLIAVLVDESASADQLRHAFDVSGPRVLVTDGVGLPEQLMPGIPVLSADTVAAAAMPGTRPRVLPTDYASIVFTSGSTGRPKGVVQSHGNLQRGCEAVASYTGISARDRILCLVPWSFDYGYGQLLAGVIQGASIATPSPVTPSGICAALEALGPTVIGGIASAYAYLVGGMSPIESTDRSSVRLLMNTGGRVPPQVLERLDRLFPSATLLLNYGLTESFRSCYLPPEERERRPAALGLPIPGVDIAIVDPEGRPLPPGAEGEIVHRGDYLFHGYWNNPAATAEALRPDPLAAPDAVEPPRALFTGDYGYRDGDGYVYFSGRRDQLLKSMGVRVSPTEVEDQLLDSPLTSSVAVFGVPNDVMGHEVWAAVVPDPAASVSESELLRELQRFARAHLSKYMQPRRYLVYDALPLTSSGKVDYEVLRAAAAESPSPSLL